MFGFALLSVSEVMNAYVIWRATTVPAITRLVPVQFVWLIGLILWLILLLGRIYGHDNLGWIATGLEFAGMLRLGALFLLFLCILVVDIITPFGFLAPG